MSPFEPSCTSFTSQGIDYLKLGLPKETFCYEAYITGLLYLAYLIIA
jgi:hypothetical protein